jgi:hypothetical protein
MPKGYRLIEALRLYLIPDAALKTGTAGSAMLVRTRRFRAKTRDTVIFGCTIHRLPQQQTCYFIRLRSISNPTAVQDWLKAHFFRKKAVR